MSHRLLVVEDDPDFVRLYSRVLPPRFSCNMARSVGEARRQLSATAVDALLLDRTLPDGDGLSFIKELRQSDQHRRLLIFMVTGHSGPENCIEALEAGADEFMEKPLDPAVLMARLNSLTRRKDRPWVDARPFSCDGLTYDPASRKVTLRKKEIELHPKELKLLEFFIENPNVVHPPESVWSSVWGPYAAHWEHTLVAALSHLRRSLGPWSEHLETRKGFGYLLATPASKKP